MQEVQGIGGVINEFAIPEQTISQFRAQFLVEATPTSSYEFLVFLSFLPLYSEDIKVLRPLSHRWISDQFSPIHVKCWILFLSLDFWLQSSLPKP